MIFVFTFKYKEQFHFNSRTHREISNHISIFAVINERKLQNYTTPIRSHCKFVYNKDERRKIFQDILLIRTISHFVSKWTAVRWILAFNILLFIIYLKSVKIISLLTMTYLTAF